MWFNLVFVFSLALSYGWAKSSSSYIDSLRLASYSLENPETYLQYYLDLGEDDRISFEARILALETAETLSKELCSFKDILQIYSHRGFIYREQGRLASAIEIFSEGFKYLDLEVEDGYETDQGGWYLIEYGNLLFKFELFEEAKETYENSFLKLKRAHSLDGMAVAYNNIGLCFSKLEQLDSAMAYFQKGYVLRKEMQNEFLMTHNLLYISRIYLSQNKELEADSILQLAKSFNKSYNEEIFVIDLQVGWAKIAISKGNYLEANAYLNALENRQKAANNYNYLATKIEIFSALNNSDSLLIYARQGINLAKRISNIDLEVEFSEAKSIAFRSSDNWNTDSLKSNGHLLSNLYKKQSDLKSDIVKRLFKANQEYIKTSAQNQMLKLEDQRKTEVIALQERSIFLTLVITLLSLIGILIFIYFYRNLNKTKNILEVIGERTRVASESMTTAIISFDSKNILRFINPTGRQYLKSIGLKKVKLNQNLPDQLNSSSRSAEWSDIFLRIREEGNSQNVSLETNKGKEYYYVYDLTRVLKTDGSYAGGIISINDLTEIQQTNMELAKKSAELRSANNAKDRMISLLAHDLKEGINSSLELTRYLVNNEMPKEEKDSSLIMLESNLAKTSNLLYKTLDWVKDQGNQQGSKRRKINLLKLVKDVERSMADKIRLKNIATNYNIDPNLKVFIDSELIRSVLRNILSNAVKFSEKDKGEISIFTQMGDENYIILHIKDNGMGMSSQELNKLTHHDYHEAKQGSDGEKGTGIGLKLVQELLLAHGSPLQVQSVLNQGSDFFFRLPIAEN
ncbi:MAG: hypothetical protein DA405_02470 [Bacteroidetes bacterium]|nr:MAG: hypothetical protein DA405_02470 [Bacteroidota bacterium]